MWTSQHSIEIQASPDKVFPWLKQMGNGRAGWYSYDWIDNFGKKSLSYINPNFQNIQAGDSIPFAKVVELDENKKITFAFGSKSTFTYELTAISSGTRLVSILKVQAPAWILNFTLGPAHDFMQKKQFQEIKKRAESMESQ